MPACTSVTVILFSVSVPVLSEQMTFMQPTVSQATSFLTSAFCFDIFMMFIASVTATIVGRPSGTAATMSTMLSMNAAENSPNISLACMPSNPATHSSITCITNMSAAAIAPISVMSLPSFASFS